MTMLGKKQSAYQKQRAREVNLGNKNGVGKRSEETISRMRTAATRRDMGVRRGMKSSAIHKERQSKSIKGWTNRISKEKYESFVNKIKEARKRQILPLVNTLPERMMQKEFIMRNIRIKTHKNVFGQPDIFIQPNICVFVDGDYWHMNPTFFKSTDKVRVGSEIWSAERKWKYDKRVTWILQKKGYVVFRFWESEIKKDVSKCVDRVINSLTFTILDRLI